MLNRLAHPRVSTLALTLASLLLASCQSPTRAQYDVNGGWITYGTMTETVRGIDPEVTVESAATVAEGTQVVVLSGTVSKVCATMGCWLEFKGESGATILVMNKDHAFFVPRNCTGRSAHAIGHVVTREQSIELLQHLAMDAGAPQSEIDAIVAPKTSVIFIADAVMLPPGGLEKVVERLPSEQDATSVDTSMTPSASTNDAPTAARARRRGGTLLF